MFEKLLDYREHIPPHRIWVFLKEESDLSALEQVHMLECVQCQHVVHVCMHSESFGAALKTLGDNGPTIAA